MCENVSNSLLRGGCELYLAVLASPDKVGFTSTAAHLIGFLLRNVSCLDNLVHERLTHEAVYSDIVLMSLSAGRTLDHEHVPERVILSVIRAQIGHTASCE